MSVQHPTQQLMSTSRKHRGPLKTRGHGRGSSAFTLVELLVVIAIIGVLAGLVLVVGRQVVSGGKEKATKQVILALDGILTDYIQQNDGALPEPYVRDPRPGINQVWPIADGYRGNGAPGGAAPSEPINSVGLFLLQASEKPSRVLIEKLPASLTRRYAPDGTTPPSAVKQPELTTAFDAWGNPIRYVHPAWDGLIHTPAQRPVGTRGTGVSLVTIEPVPTVGGVAAVLPFTDLRRGAFSQADRDAILGSGTAARQAL